MVFDKYLIVNIRFTDEFKAVYQYSEKALFTIFSKVDLSIYLNNGDIF